jgi:hypothetical protein
MSQHGPSPKRHHTVPRFYLRRFADEHERVMRVPLEAGTSPHRVKVINLAVESYFYQAELSNGSATGQIEEMLSALEDEWKPAIEAFVGGNWSQRIRASVASWVAMQFLRTTWVREEIRAAAELIGEHMDRHGDRPAGWRWHPNAHLAGMLKAHRQIVEILAGRAWSVVSFRHKALITSDNPVVLLPKADADEFTPLGMASNGGVYVPLDRRMGLLLTEHKFGVELPGTAARAREFNQCVAWNAHRAVFHHPDDHAILDQIELPTPGDPELGFEVFTLETLAEHLQQRGPTPRAKPPDL